MTDQADQPKARLRAHHLLCLLAFSGEGYSPAFERRFAALAKVYRDAASLLEILASPDDACDACPHLTTSAGCISPDDGPEASVVELDRAVLATLRLSTGTHLAADVHSRLRNVSRAELDALCSKCSWFGRTDCQELIVEWLAR